MKTLFWFTLLIITSISLHGQTSVSKEELQGTWEVNYTKTLNALSSSKRNQYDSLDVSLKDDMKAKIDGQKFTFENNDRFIAITTGGKTYTGQWSISPNNTLILEYEQGSKLSQKIESLGANELVFRLADQTNSQILFHHLYLDKIN